MQKVSDKKIKIVDQSGQNVPGPAALRKNGNFFSFFSFPKTEAREKNIVTVVKEPVHRKSQTNIPSVNIPAVKNWVALEEKIVHDYKEQKTILPKISVPLAKNPAKPTPPAFETFSTQTAVTLSPGVLKVKDPLRVSPGVFSGVAKFLMVCGGLAAGVFLLMQILSGFGASQKLTQLQNEKKQLEQSYAELKNASENQSAEMKWLNSQLRDVGLELRTAKANKAAYEQSLEKKYQEELMRITVQYESELDRLRGVLQTQGAIITALKAQGQAFDKIIDQAGLSALSGAAAGFSQGPVSMSSSSAFQKKITSVNARQGSIVINFGSEQGARSGRDITILQNGVGLTVARIDRVYPTMSVAVVPDARMLQVIKEGDSVSFS